MSLPLGLTLALLPALAADEDLPKRPDRPFTVFVFATPELPGPADLTQKPVKEIVDSASDVRKHITGKRKDWMRLVTRPEEAEVVVEVKARQYETGHGYVLEGQVMLLDVLDTKIIGQGGLNTQQIFNIWRTAADDLAGRLEYYVLRKDYARLKAARDHGAKPWAGRATDEGDRELDAGHLTEAVAAYDRALAASPSFLRALFNRGLAHSRAGNHQQAAADMTRAIELDPKLVKAYFHRGQARMALGSRAEALGDFAEAQRLDPKFAPTYLARGNALLEEKRYAEAAKDLDEAAQLGGKDPALYFNQGLAHAALAREMTGAEKDTHLRSAVAAFNEAVALSPSDKEAWAQRAEAQARRGNYTQAVSDYTRAIDLGQRTSTVLVNRGVCQARLGNADKALADYSDAIAADPQSALAYWNRSQVYKKKGQATKAAADRKKALALDPAVEQGESSF